MVNRKYYLKPLGKTQEWQYLLICVSAASHQERNRTHISICEDNLRQELATEYVIYEYPDIIFLRAFESEIEHVVLQTCCSYWQLYFRTFTAMLLLY